ncbi:unnamed protein product [Urochloa decumbens]|uniref:Ubiquitin-like protease family profile domain-containing protein n=1 Tax=Urochloa decumbens TaxID=240449 RepID=A0ABC9B5K1_9POAL
MTPHSRIHSGGGVLGNDHEVSDESDNHTGDGNAHDSMNAEAHDPSAAEVFLSSVDDEALFGAFKRFVSSSLRKIISDAENIVGASTIDSCGGPRACAPVTKAVSRISSAYFSDVIDSLSQKKRDVIHSYGFGSLLLFDKCKIPEKFSRWVLDHVHTSKSEIVLGNKSIHISPQIVNDILGIPIGGKTISKADPESGKLGFLSSMKLTTLPSARSCGDKLLEDNISDDELVRNFLVVALVTFLCPNSRSVPSTEYLEPLVNVKEAKEWDWSKFVHYWLLKQITKYHKRMKGTDLESTTMGGCKYIICVAYLDFLNVGNQHLPLTLPRILVWKGDMIKDRSKLDHVQGHVYGKCPLLPFKSTCYSKSFASKTPSPECCLDSSKFKKTLTENFDGTLSPKTVDGIAELYLKHVAAPNVSHAETTASIIVDVINYFYQRAQHEKRSGSSNLQGNGEGSGRDVSMDDPSNGNLNCHKHQSHSPVHPGPGYVCGNAHGRLHEETVGVAQANQNNGDNTRVAADTQQNYANSSDTEIVPSTGGEYLSSSETVLVSPSLDALSDQFIQSQGGYSQSKRRRFSNSPSSGNNQISGHTVAGRTRSHMSPLSQQLSTSLTEQDGFVDNPEAILRNRKTKRVVARVQQGTDLNNTQEQHMPNNNNDLRSSEDLSNVVDETNSAVHTSFVSKVANPILNAEQARLRLKEVVNKNLKDRLVIHTTSAPPPNKYDGQDSCSNSLLTEHNQYHPIAFNTNSKVGDSVLTPRSNETPATRGVAPVCTQKSASFDHLLATDSVSHPIRQLDPPSVNRALLPPKPVIMSDINPPSFRLLEDFDDDYNYIEDPRKRRRAGLPCDGKTFYDDPTCLASHEVRAPPDPKPNASNRSTQSLSQTTPAYFNNKSQNEVNKEHMDLDSHTTDPIFDKTPDSPSRPLRHEAPCCTSPLATVDKRGNTIFLTSQESPETPEVQITGVQTVHAACSSMTSIADQIYNEPHMTCFQKCQRIKFDLGSSSAGKKPRRPRRIVEPNSYYRNFQVNTCKIRFTLRPEDLLAYECINFFSSDPQYASKEVINYDNVHVSYQQLGTLRRSDKVPVDMYVINAFCRKLFKDKHPKDSLRHYFFSTVGDYLMNHPYEGNPSFLHDNCGKCFKLANGCFKFTASDYLFFPIFHRGHWFVFVVALQDGYFIFLDSQYHEDEEYQKNVRSVVIPNFVKAWDEFICIDWDFDEFVIHHAPVPKHDMKYYSKYDDGIFVMKYMELWDPRVNMMQKFSSINIPDIRVQFMYSMVFSEHNSNTKAKNTVTNHKAMLQMKRVSALRQATSMTH